MELRKKNKEIFNYFGLIFGKAGSGKTSLLANSKDTFFIGNERNIEFDLEGRALNPVKNYNEFLEQLEWFKKNKPKNIKTLVIDNYSDIEQMLIKSFAGEANISTWNRGWGAGQAELEKKTRNLIQNYLVPIRDHIANVILLTHCDDAKEVDNQTQAEYSNYRPNLEKRGLKPLEAILDFMFHIHVPIFKQDSKNLNRAIYTTYSAGSYCKRKSNILTDNIIIFKKDDTNLWANTEKKFKNSFEKKDDIKSIFLKVQSKGLIKKPFDELLKEFGHDILLKKLNNILEKHNID